jgi:hypothetical protein
MSSNRDNSADSYGEHKARGKAGLFRRGIYDLLLKAGRGMTDREMMERLGAEDPNLVRPEVTRLAQDGILRRTGDTTCPVTGRKVRISTLTGKPYRERGKVSQPAPSNKQRIRQLEAKLSDYEEAIRQLCREAAVGDLGLLRILQVTARLHVPPSAGHKG